MQSVVKINFANQIASMKFWNNSQKTPKGSKGWQNHNITVEMMQETHQITKSRWGYVD